MLISPQDWGTMFLSKHHYAVTLAGKGNLVYFLNPPSLRKFVTADQIQIEPVEKIKNLYLINHYIKFPYFLKFKWIGLFHFLMRFHINKILKNINRPIDIVWSFDLGNLYSFSFFPDCYKIFHPVDEPLNKTAINSAKGANIIFSVTQEILNKYQFYNVQKKLIHHGIASYFLNRDISNKINNPLRVGISGNFLRSDIDREILLQIIRDNKEIIFECWGAYNNLQSNISGADDAATTNFIKQLQQQENVNLYGAIVPEKLAIELQKVDLFLICYDVQKDQSKGTNYHKVMEYLSTGKPIISNNISTYSNQPDLVMMVKERTDNKKLPDLFKHVVNNIKSYNSAEKQRVRVQFASDNTYNKQIEKIEKYINL